MDKMKDLKDLLRHEVLDLVSAEDQMIEGMPAMIERATNPELKRALTEHLRITERQRKRLDEVTKLLGEEPVGENSEGSTVGNLVSRFFGGGAEKCKAMEGLITEGSKMMKEDMNEEVMDAAIISCSQKIEHYEICGYGTAKAFARELQLKEVENLLNETLQEEYEADRLLTRMAVGGGINEMAEQAESGSGNKSGSGKKGASGRNKSSAGKKSSSGGGKKSSSNSSSGGKKSSGSSSTQSGKKSSSNSSSDGKKSSGSSSSGSKGAAKKSSSVGSSSGKKSSSGGSSSGKKPSSGGSSSSGKKSSSGGGKKSAGGSSSGSGNRGASSKSAAKASSGGNKGGKKSATAGKKSSGGKGGASRGGGRGR
ncbi:MAG TPA: ferritin-like domain-containing protein [Segetibacter sp.]|jgi:ferritin-like metal-binding protein YciE